jgi:hypothetical protein
MRSCCSTSPLPKVDLSELVSPAISCVTEVPVGALTVTLPNGADNPTDLQFLSSKVGWVTANIGSSHVHATGPHGFYLLKSTDGGIVWNTITTV